MTPQPATPTTQNESMNHEEKDKLIEAARNDVRAALRKMETAVEGGDVNCIGIIPMGRELESMIDCALRARKADR